MQPTPAGGCDMGASDGPIRWSLYPTAAGCAEARAWVELQRKLLRAPKTIDAYARGVDDYLRVCARLAIDVRAATRHDIAAYLDDLAHRAPHRPRGARRDAPRADAPHVDAPQGLAHRTLHLRLTVVRLFYDYLRECGQRTSNPVGRGQYRTGDAVGDGEGWTAGARPLIPRRERPPWLPTDAEWQAFLGVLTATEPLRNQLLAYLAYDGALRRAELLALRVADVDFPHQLVRVRPETAKNAAGRVVCYGDATSALLVAYLPVRQALVAGASVSQGRPHGAPRDPPRSGPSGVARPGSGGALFLSTSPRNRAQALGVGSWNQVVQRVARRAGVPQFTTHTFRHLRLTDLARCRLDLHEIASYAGHRHLKTTHQYIRLSGTELAARVRGATAQLDARLHAYLHAIGRDEGRHHAR